MKCAFAYRNLADTATVTASSVAGNMFPTRVQDVHVAEKWRATSGSAYLTFDLGGVFYVDTVALFGLNLTLTGQAQVRLSATDAIAVAGLVYNSGSVAGRVDQRYGYLVDCLPSLVQARYIRIDMSDTAVAAVEAGRAFIGARTELEVGYSAGASDGYVDLSKISRSRGGQSYVDRNVTYRTIDVTFELLNGSERRGIIDEIDRVVGQRQDLLFLKDVNSDNMGRDSLWCLRDDIQPTVQPYTVDIYRKSFRLSERL